MGPNQDVAAKRSTVHHPDVERRVQELVFWKVLRTKTENETNFRSSFMLVTRTWIQYLRYNFVTG